MAIVANVMAVILQKIGKNRNRLEKTQMIIYNRIAKKCLHY